MIAPNEINPLFFNRYRDNNGVNDLAPFFNNQETLWQKMETIGTNPLQKHEVNVLTMRLLLAQDALKGLKQYELEIRRKPGQYIIPTQAQLTVSGVLNHTFYPDPSTGNAGEVFSPPKIRVHEHFYSFVSSLVSTLDWLANEINAIYGLGISRVDWDALCRKSNLLSNKNPKLKQIIDTLAASPYKTRLFDCRNVSEHQGVVQIDDVLVVNDIVTIDDGYHVMVADNPRDPASPAHTPLIQDAKSLFFFVVEDCCDAVYEAMI
jgi:hypothetical protein